MKSLKIVGLGLAIWLLSWGWLELNLILASPLALGVAIGLTAVLLVCFLGQYLYRHNNSLVSPAAADPISPHAHPTLPMPRIHLGSIHSHPTRPTSLGFK